MTELTIHSDEHFMRQALNQAKLAYEEKEIPIGAIVVSEKRIVARAHNQVERLDDATAHAEMLALTAAQNHLNSKYLNDCTLYVTLEPCTMCAGALFWTQIGRIVIGARDDKRGFDRLKPDVIHPTTKVEFGLLSQECKEMIKDFFKEMRRNNF